MPLAVAKREAPHGPLHPAARGSAVRERRESIDSVGTRTRDLRIKSPLLYQLSYRVVVRTCWIPGTRAGSGGGLTIAELEARCQRGASQMRMRASSERRGSLVNLDSLPLDGEGSHPHQAEAGGTDPSGDWRPSGGADFPVAVGRPWSVPNLSRTYSRLRDMAGLPRDLVLYLARHECRTKICWEKGMEYARRLLGHANISTTQRTCTSLNASLRTRRISWNNI